MRAFFVLARMRVLDVVRSRVATLLFLGLPLAILLVLALVFAEGHPFEQKTILVVGQSPRLGEFEHRLAGFPELALEAESSREVALARLRSRSASALLLQAESGRLEILVGDGEQVFGRGLVSVLGPDFSLGSVPTPRWGYLRFLFPGLLSSAVMFAGLFSMGYAMARYRQNLFLKKLATTPLRKSTFLFAQVTGRALLVLLQVGLLTLVAALVFDIPLSWPRALALGLIALLGLIVFCGLGLAIATGIKAEAVVNDVISALGLPIALLSGIFFPITSLPGPMRRVCAMLPSTLLVDATRDTILYGETLGHELLPLAGLCAWGLFAFILSLSLFRWHE